jgi:hypothetical protein
MNDIVRRSGTGQWLPGHAFRLGGALDHHLGLLGPLILEARRINAAAAFFCSGDSAASSGWG